MSSCQLGAAQGWGDPLLFRIASSDAVENRQEPLRPWFWPSVMLATVVTVGVLQYLTPVTKVHWLYILQRAYYVPIVLAGLSWGWRRGLMVALLSGGGFAIGTPSIWKVRSVDVLDQCLEICVFCLVGLTAGVLTDQRNKQERALRHTTSQLRQAHHELQENFDSMKRAERLYALGQMSAGLAHEIRNPLASIEGAVTVLQREGSFEERRREFLDIIQKESRRLNRLLTQFLNFAKPADPDLKMVEIDDLLGSVIDLARHANGVGGLELRKEVQPGVSRVACDPEQMKQVLLNLIVNAVQAMPEGGSVVLAARQDDAGITIDVQDQGTGIHENDVERVFDPFFTTKETGTGLGLSVAHQIVSQHGGELTILRNAPLGVTVRISLPLRASLLYDQGPDSCSR
jgi:two-component system, NtrC family, sensor histidine kinase HydH